MLAKKLEIYLGDSDRVMHKPLSDVLIQFLRDKGIAGATMLRGIEGFGAKHQIHAMHVFALSTDLPVVIVAIDTPDKISSILDELKELVGEGLIIESDVTVHKLDSNNF